MESIQITISINKTYDTNKKTIQYKLENISITTKILSYRRSPKKKLRVYNNLQLNKPQLNNSQLNKPQLDNSQSNNLQLNNFQSNNSQLNNFQSNNSQLNNYQFKKYQLNNYQFKKYQLNKKAKKGKFPMIHPSLYQ